MFFRILVKQLKHKWKLNALLFLTMTALVSLYVFILNTNGFSVRSMQLIMKNMGLNQFIIPENQSAADVYLCTDGQKDFSEQVTHTVAAQAELLSRYYLSMLQQRREIAGRSVVLTGILPVSRADETEEKGNPVKPVKPGTVRLGFAAAAAFDACEGGEIELEGRKFQVAAVRSEQGTMDDARVFLHLADAQEILGKPGKINVIYSFECLHVGGSLESIHQYQRDALARVLPGFKQINIANISQGRYHARGMTEKYLYYLLLSVGAITVLIFVITGFQEVAERKYETGVLVAQGAGYPYVIGLYLCKTLALTLLAALLGFALGGGASVHLTPPFLQTNTKEIHLIWSHLPPTLALFGFVSFAAEFIPMLKLVRMDPCAILMEE